ncbi:MAG: hypothetical protein GY944_22290 [bacterium]|nr:hypothetical protein [bacterium]
MSTILDALRKVEGQRPASAGARELDRKIVEQEARAPARPVRRLAIVSAAVLFSAAAGVGVTLLGLSFAQERLLPIAADTPGEVPPVAAAEAAVPETAERAESVVVAAEVLEAQPARQAEPESIPTAIFARPPRVPDDRPAVIVATPPLDREPVVIPDPAPPKPTRDPVARLEAAREARLSRAPREPTPQPEVQVEPERPPVEIIEIARANPKPPTPPATLREPDPTPLPVIVRGELPKVAVTGTTWHPFNERRRAQVRVMDAGEASAVEVREGDTIGPFEVREITPTGVTLLHEGVEMQRRVGAAAR